MSLWGLYRLVNILILITFINVCFKSFIHKLIRFLENANYKSCINHCNFHALKYGEQFCSLNMCIPLICIDFISIFQTCIKLINVVFRCTTKCHLGVGLFNIIQYRQEFAKKRINHNKVIF